MYLGIDIGGTNFKSGLLDKNLKLTTRNSVKINNESSNSELINILFGLIDKEIESAGKIKSIGIGTPGLVSEDGKLSYAPNLPNLKNIELEKIVREKYSLPVKVDNDANAASLAELELGAGKTENSFLYLTLGTGIGGTIIHNRKIFRGLENAAGEAGHIIVDFDAFNMENLEEYRLGTMESFAGKDGIIELARKELDRRVSTFLKNPEMLRVRKISDLANSGDEAAIATLVKTGLIIGTGVASALNLLGLFTVIIGGGISRTGKILFDSIEETVKKKAMPHIAEKVKIKKSEFTRDCGIIGAAILGKNYGI